MCIVSARVKIYKAIDYVQYLFLFFIVS